MIYLQQSPNAILYYYLRLTIRNPVGRAD